MQQESWDGRRDGGSADRHIQVAAALPGSPHTNRAPSCSTQTAAPRRQLCPSPRTRASGSQVLHLLRFLPSEPLAHLLWEAPPTTPAPRGPCTACLNHSCPHRLSGEIKGSPIPPCHKRIPSLEERSFLGRGSLGQLQGQPPSLFKALARATRTCSQTLPLQPQPWGPTRTWAGPQAELHTQCCCPRMGRREDRWRRQEPPGTPD